MEEYGAIKQVLPKFPVMNLIRISHKKEYLTVTETSFGIDSFKKNIEKLRESYCFPNTWEIISFREPTTSESISYISHKLIKMKKRGFLNFNWMQVGRVLKAGEGVWVNMPKDSQGKTITDETELKRYLKGVAPVKVNKGRVYIVPNREGLRDLGYAEYGSFEQGVQESATFAYGGLARILDHTEELCTNLLDISSKNNFRRGVNVTCFDKSNQTFPSLVGFDCRWSLLWDMLYIDGGWNENIDKNGFVIGVLDESRIPVKTI
jgi:hypothetical protein